MMLAAMCMPKGSWTSDSELLGYVFRPIWRWFCAPGAESLMFGKSCSHCSKTIILEAESNLFCDEFDAMSWFSMGCLIDNRGFPLMFIDFRWFSLMIIDFHWFSMIFIDPGWESKDLRTWIFIDFHWLSWIIIDLAMILCSGSGILDVRKIMLSL